MAKGTITAVHPLLPMRDQAESRTFYEALGFDALLAMDGYLIMGRDGVELHFWPCSDRAIAENTSCYIRSSDVDALHAEFSAGFPAGEGVRLTAPENREWGMREFYVFDPSGNLLKIGQPTPR